MKGIWEFPTICAILLCQIILKNKFCKKNAEMKWKAEDLKVKGVGLSSCMTGCVTLD